MDDWKVKILLLVIHVTKNYYLNMLMNFSVLMKRYEMNYAITMMIVKRPAVTTLHSLFSLRTTHQLIIGKLRIALKLPQHQIRRNHLPAKMTPLHLIPKSSGTEGTTLIFKEKIFLFFN